MNAKKKASKINRKPRPKKIKIPAPPAAPRAPEVTLKMPADIAGLCINGLKVQDPTGVFVGAETAKLEHQLARQLKIEPKPQA